MFFFTIRWGRRVWFFAELVSTAPLVDFFAVTLQWRGWTASQVSRSSRSMCCRWRIAAGRWWTAVTFANRLSVSQVDFELQTRIGCGGGECFTSVRMVHHGRNTRSSTVSYDPFTKESTHRRKKKNLEGRAWLWIDMSQWFKSIYTRRRWKWIRNVFKTKFFRPNQQLFLGINGAFRWVFLFFFLGAGIEKKEK